MDQVRSAAAAEVAANLRTVRSQIAAAAKTANRAVDEVTLVAVGKVQPVASVW